ncbi:hypothetical protein T07_11813 [Trichinella nelsoni]|uniref:Uncharacterized protein n=1 Tax=Trichinella nelsoni TaxID=6336 RepID=A0A0V0RF17_9BILA|nr:hypothetical protein T07_11813 [Trichinella nelsoni]
MWTQAVHGLKDAGLRSSFTVSNIIKMDGVQDEKCSTSENVPCNQSSVQSCSISEERSILLSQAAIMDVVENLRTSNKRDGVESLTARQTWPNISGFQVGRRFKSFLEFEQAFDAWKSEHFHTFRVASSETLRLKDVLLNNFKQGVPACCETFNFLNCPISPLVLKSHTYK